MKRVSVALTDDQLKAVDRLILEHNRDSWRFGGRMSRDRMIGALVAAELRRRVPSNQSLEHLNQVVDQK